MAQRRKFAPGDKFGHLTVTAYNSVTARYLCMCDCGNTTEAGASALRNGKHRSCGCPQYRAPRRTSIRPGDVFGNLTVIEYTYGRWLCSCVCGGTTLAEAPRLKSGQRRGCGCLQTSTFERPHTWLPDDLSFKHKLFGTYVRQAGKRGHTFELTFNAFVGFLQRPCHYCGVAASNTMVTRTKTQRSERLYRYNGLDRVDSAKGYADGNLVPCCKKCNTAKNSMSVDDWFEWVSRVYHHSIEPIIGRANAEKGQP